MDTQTDDERRKNVWHAILTIELSRVEKDTEFHPAGVSKIQKAIDAASQAVDAFDAKFGTISPKV